MVEQDLLLRKRLKTTNLPQYANRGLFFSKYVERSSSDKGNQNTLKKGVGLTSNTPKLESFHKWAKQLKGVESFTLETKARLLIDMAGGVLENANINLDRISGEPFIAGSALKGCARTVAIEKLKELCDAEKPIKEQKELLDQIISIFGHNEGDSDILFAFANTDKIDNELKKSVEASSAAKVAFLPAYPIKANEALDIDVMTPHHQKYYGGDEKMPEATDTENPIPVFFPAVPQEKKFGFYVIPVHGGTDADTQLAMEWLKEGLTVNGIGAKTNAGYGWFGEKEKEPERIDHIAEEKGLEVVHVEHKGDYSKVTFEKKIMELASNPGQYNKLKIEVENLKKPENIDWLKEFIEKTKTGKDYKKLRSKDWYTDLTKEVK